MLFLKERSFFFKHPKKKKLFIKKMVGRAITKSAPNF